VSAKLGRKLGALGITQNDGPMRDADKMRNEDIEGGHPTVGGPLNKSRRRRSVFEESPGNGRPGVPRYVTLEERHGKAGGRIPGPVPIGPVQPGVIYDDGENEGV